MIGRHGEQRVTVTVTFSIDVEGWCAEYGLDPADPTVAHEDAVRYFEGVGGLVPRHLTGIVTAEVQR